ANRVYAEPGNGRSTTISGIMRNKSSRSFFLLRAGTARRFLACQRSSSSAMWCTSVGNVTGRSKRTVSCFLRKGNGSKGRSSIPKAVGGRSAENERHPAHRKLRPASRHSPRQERPTRDQGRSTERREGTHPSDPAQCEHIQTSRKQHHAEHKEPSHRCHAECRIPLGHAGEQTQRQGMVHLVARPGFKRSQHGGVQDRPEHMGTEGSGGDR